MTLRETALRGGAHLVGREVMGLVLRFAGALVVTRLIGPSSFGVYIGALAAVTVFVTAAQLGGEVFLIRRQDEPSRRTYDEVFTVLVVTSTVVVVLGLLGSILAASVIDSPSAIAAFQVLVLGIPMSVLWAPAQAKLERGFRFRALAYLQVGSDAALYGVATVLALAGLGVWSPVLGTLAASGFLLVGSYALAGYRPRLAFSRERTREFGRFGIQFVPSPLLWTLTQLVNPIVVGTMLGSASVGYVALATRLADTAGFVVRATYRIALVSLSRVQNDLPRLRRGFEEMLTLQAIGVGVPLAALAVAAPPLLPVLFGDEWRPALDVLPFVSFGLLMLAVFNTHLALLYVFGRTLATSGVALVRFALLAGTALLLVPSLELIGYGLAVLVASTSWILADRVLRRNVDFRYGSSARWFAALAPPLAIPLFDSPWSLVLLVPIVALLVLHRDSRTQLRDYLALARRLGGRADDVAEPDGVAPHFEKS